MSPSDRSETVPRICLDRAAGAPLRPEARRAMSEVLELSGGNPSSLHAEGRTARRIVEEARVSVARLACCEADDLVFTSGGTESNRLALEGFVREFEGRKPRVLAGKPDHPSVIGCLEDLSSRGIPTALLPVDSEGFLSSATGTGNWEPGTGNAFLLSLLWVNNEIGTIQDANSLVRDAKARGWTVHVDACQALGKLDMGLLAGADLITLSSAKIGGPAGCGALVIRKGAPWKAPWTGGKQEGRRRPGTEALVLASGFGAAAGAASREGSNPGSLRENERAFLAGLRDSGTAFKINGPEGEGRIPGLINISFPGWEADQLCAALDLAGLAASPGAACSSGVIRSSPILEALGLKGAEARSGVRFSFGEEVSEADLLDAARRVAAVVGKLEAVSRLGAAS